MSRAEPAVACIAPVEYRDTLCAGLRACGTRARFLPRPKPLATTGGEGLRQDAFGIDTLARGLKGEVQGILLVSPKRRSARRAVPGPVVAGIPVGLLPSDRPEDLVPWLSALQNQERGTPTWAVMAMWRQSYLSLGRRFVGWLRGANANAVDAWFADQMSREEVCRRLASGPRIALYVGHGRSRGLCGYRGLRWHHVAAVPQTAACGTVMCFACETLKRDRGAIPFGYRWVMGGRAAAFFGSVDAVSVKANVMLANRVGSIFARSRARTIGELLTLLDRETAADPLLDGGRMAFDTYRLIGSPVQSLF